MKKKIQAGILLVAGGIAAVIGIAAGVAGMQGETRGYLLVTGVILIMLGFRIYHLKKNNTYNFGTLSGQIDGSDIRSVVEFF